MRNKVTTKVAIIMSAPWRAGMLRNAKAVARLFVASREDLQVVIGIRTDGPYDWQTMEHEFDLLERVELRRFQWQAVDSRDAARIHCFDPPTVARVYAPRDGVYDFLDCQAWIVFSNSLEGYVTPCRPIGVFCADLIQRYVPEIFGGKQAKPMWDLQAETFSSWQNARLVFSTTPATRQDVIDYADVDAQRALVLPMLIDPVAAALGATKTVPPPERPFILWVTNASPHKNAHGALAALKIYYDELNGKLDVVICGQDTEKLNPAADNRAELAKAFAEHQSVLPRLRFVGEVSDETYQSLIGSASVIWHNVIVDNGTFVAFDAARANKQLVSSDYPQMRYLCERYGVFARFHPHDDARLAAQALLEAQSDALTGQPASHNLVGDDPTMTQQAYGDMLTRLLAA